MEDGGGMQLLCQVSLSEAGCTVLLTAKSQVRHLKASLRLKELSSETQVRIWLGEAVT